MSNLPHDPNLEAAVIGCILVAPEVLPEMAISAEHFYIHRHQWIMTAIEKLSKEHKNIDIIAVSHELGKANQLEEIGGSAYLTSTIGNNRVNSYNGPTYAAQVKELAARRKIIRAANEILNMAYKTDGPLPFDVVVSEMRIKLDEALNHSVSPKGKPMLDLTRDFNAKFEELQRSDYRPAGISSGYQDIDDLLDGFQNGKLYLIAARPGHGKSAMLGNFAANAAKQGKRVLFFSAEMDQEQIYTRLFSAESHLDIHNLNHGILQSDEESKAYMQAIKTCKSLPIRIYNPNECGQVEQIENVTRQLYARGEVDIIFVDYAQLLATKLDSRMATREQEVSKIANALKRIANIGIPVVAAAQLNRMVDTRADKRPLLSDLRESGALEQSADVVCFLYYPQDEVFQNGDEGSQGKKQNDNSCIMDFVVAKNRSGKLADCPLVYSKSTQKINSGIRKRLDLNPERQPKLKRLVAPD